MKNILMKVLVLISVLLTVTYANTCIENNKQVLQNITIICKNGLYSLKKDNKLIFPQNYKSIQIEKLSNNLIYVKQKQKDIKANLQDAYIINISGKITYKSHLLSNAFIKKIPFWKLFAITFHNIPSKNGNSGIGLLDNNGKVLIDSGKYLNIDIPKINQYYIKKYDKHYLKVSSYTVSKNIKGRYKHYLKGLIDGKGNEVIPPIYEKIYQIDKNSIIVYKDNFAMMIDKYKNIIIPSGKYKKIKEGLKNTNTLLVTDNIASFLIDKNDMKILYTLKKGEYIENFVNDVWAVKNGGKIQKLINKTLKPIFDIKKYDYVEPFSKILIKVRKNYNYGIITKEEKIVVPIKYDKIQRLTNTISWLKLFNKKTSSVYVGSGVYYAQKNTWKKDKYELYFHLDRLKPKEYKNIKNILNDRSKKRFLFNDEGKVIPLQTYSSVKIVFPYNLKGHYIIKAKKDFFSSWKTILNKTVLNKKILINK